MAMTDQVPTEPDKVERLADEFLARYRAGDRPSIDQFVSNDAEIADELRSLLKAIVILEQNAPPADSTVRAGKQDAAIAEEVPHQIGDYLIEREIGRGGMGIVYKAAQQSLDRQVALKVLSSPGPLDSAHLERFRREARAAARLQHNHIVPVFDFGTQSGVYYYAMQLIVGQSLDVVIRSLQNSRATTQHFL